MMLIRYCEGFVSMLLLCSRHPKLLGDLEEPSSSLSFRKFGTNHGFLP